MNAIAFASFPSKQFHGYSDFGFVVETPRGWERPSDRLVKSFLATGCAELRTGTQKLRKRPANFRAGAFV